MPTPAFGLTPAFDYRNPASNPPAQLARRRVMRQADTAPLSTGDMVCDLLDDPGVAGVPATTAIAGSTVAGRRGGWGVVLAVEPQTPQAPTGATGIAPTVPAVKASNYYVWVLEVSPNRDLWAVASQPMALSAIGGQAQFTFAATSPVGFSRGQLTPGGGGLFQITDLAPDAVYPGNAATQAAGRAAVWTVRCTAGPVGIPPL